ncbi:MAG: glycosyltransferase family 4 protein [Phycisphaerales bacterium]|nr:glycosyltransferase family 4 protein [Phycisphaerales bacterium]
MKVALIIEWLDASRGGAETSTQQFMHELIRLGVQLEVFTRSRIPSRPGINVHTVRCKGPLRALRSRDFIRRADSAAMHSQAEIIHAISPSLAANVYQPRGGTIAETIVRNRAVRKSRSAQAFKQLLQYTNVKERMLLRLERKMLGDGDPPVVLALSDYVIRQLHEHYQLPDERIRKVFNGVDPDTSDAATRAANRREIRAMYAVPDDAILALTVAHNFRLKGVHTLIEALQQVRAEWHVANLRVLVAGKSKPEAWENLVRRLHLNDVVQFVGPTQRIRAFYHAADFLVHPTFYDPCSRVVLEALSSGLPCITTRYDGAAEMVADEVNGFVLDMAGDPRILAERIANLCDADVRRRMREAVGGLPAADMRKHAEAVFEIYQSMVEGAGGR